ncbi:MAG TPA: outer membrane beta-barrel protein [Cyclobacteriaceae bacterium]|jgi:hypothetical protein|nr:outer membrane beta-barrel protein [Cyclobacteriaceae bacterium]
MKKILLCCLALTLFNAAFAQFNMGRMLVGGSVGFSSTSQKSSSGGVSSTTDYTTLAFGPSLGYFVANNFAAGAGVNWSSSKYSSDGGPSTTSSSFMFVPFVRYYIAPGFFGQGTFGFGSSKTASSVSTVKGSATQWSLGIGYAYFLNDHVAIEPIVQYQLTSTKYDYGTPSDQKIDVGGVAINIGLKIYLGDRN